MTQVRSESWGQVAGQGSVDLWTLQSSQLQVELLTLGAIMHSVRCRSKSGRMEDVVRGFDHLDGYVSDRRLFGAVVGRVTNRIAGGRFVVDGTEYQLDLNSGPNALHGGLRGFNKAIWRATAVDGGVQLSHVSPDGDQRYPGEVHVSVTYLLQGETLSVEFRARSSRTTPINLTSHSYFNLAGPDAVDIYDHHVAVYADSYLPVDETSVPTGEIRSVQDSPFDLRKPVAIGAQMKKLPGSGFDHNFCLCSPGDPWSERVVARVSHPVSGRVLQVTTTQPGLQLYTANVLDGSLVGKCGRRYGKHSAICLETQNWPDAVNQASFPDALLRPGEEYRHVTRYTFTTA
ncbi:galactose mutarotase [Neosynchiropus ocellatus]